MDPTYAAALDALAPYIRGYDDARLGVFRSGEVGRAYLMTWAFGFAHNKGLRLSLVDSEDGYYGVVTADVVHGCVRGTDVPEIRLEGREGEPLTACDDPCLALLTALAAALSAP